MLKEVQIHLMAQVIDFRIRFYAVLKFQTFHNVSETASVMENRQLSLKEKVKENFKNALHEYLNLGLQKNYRFVA